MKRHLSTTHIGGLEIVRVVRDVEPIEFGPHGADSTLGQLVDAAIANALREGHHLQDICIRLDAENHAAAHALRQLYLGENTV